MSCQQDSKKRIHADWQTGVWANPCFRQMGRKIVGSTWMALGGNIPTQGATPLFYNQTGEKILGFA